MVRTYLFVFLFGLPWEKNMSFFHLPSERGEAWALLASTISMAKVLLLVERQWGFYVKQAWWLVAGEFILAPTGRLEIGK